MKRTLCFSLILLLMGVLESAAWGQTVTRGPYLQQQTDQSIIVRWRTDIATNSVVRYGTNSASLNLSSSDPAFSTEHAVQLIGLSAVTRYFYSVGSSASALAGDLSYHFETSPVPGTAADTRFWVIGDSGTANANALAVRDAFKTWSASQAANFMLMLGDNAYNDGTDEEYQNAVFNIYPELLRQLPVWSTLGNHDGHTADSATQSGPYYDIFDLPTAGEAGGLASGTEAYYAFDYGNIHFVVMDSYETNRSPGGNMLLWLESDLALNNKPWLIAFFHHPPYTKGSHNSDTEGRLIDMRQNALPILEAWGVDLVMTGHSHSYERSFLLDGHYGFSETLDFGLNILDIGDGRETSDGVYEKPDIVAAEHAGAVYAVAGSSGKVTNASLNHPVMLVSLASLGSMIVDIAGSRMDVTFLDQNAVVRDEFTIMKTPDFEAPLITAASAEDASHVRVDYSERVDAASATDTANYVIAGLSISAAELLAGNSTVRLTTAVMTAGSSYVLTVNNVRDEIGNTIAIDSQAGFEFNPQMSKAFQDGLAPSPDYDGTFDTYIREASATTNYGLATTLQVDGDEPSGTGTDMSILLAWDISEIPADATVLTATIYLSAVNVSSGPYFCDALLRPWDQTQATWNQATSSTAWGAPGALAASDRDSVTLCTVSAPGLGLLSINLNTDGVAMVQSWVDGSVANYGMVISDSATSNGADFESSESGNAMDRPKLEIVYIVPSGLPNSPPVAAFSKNCTNLGCTFTDGSSDSDGTIVSWSWDFDHGATSSDQDAAHTYATAGTYTVSLTVTDNDGVSANTSTAVTVTDPPQFVDYVANGQITVSGTVEGSYLDTRTKDSFSQSIRERESGGKKQNRHSFLEHKWTFSVAPAAGFVLNMHAWQSASPDGDNFEFAWSRNNNDYFSLGILNSSSLNNNQAFILPPDLTGPVYIRVVDTNRSSGRDLDTVFIDHLYIRAENGPGSKPDAPSGLAAEAQSDSSIKLDWLDNADDESGFELQRSTDALEWTVASNPGIDAQSASDTGLSPSTTYHYRIRAFNLAGSSDWIDGASAKTTAGPPPLPIILTLTGSKSRGKHVITLDWTWPDPTAGSGSVDIYRDDELLNTEIDNGQFIDSTSNKGAREYTYQVCDADTVICSAIVSIVF